MKYIAYTMCIKYNASIEYIDEYFRNYINQWILAIHITTSIYDLYHLRIHVQIDKM